jgi:glycosyltransferase involved in cell wall biosynthesis
MPGKPLPSLSITFPCYNEEANVERTTRMALECASRFTDDLEVVIVNDGSKDKTAEIADRLVAENPGVVRVIHNNPKKGYGGALKAGLYACSKEYIFFTDGDTQFDMSEIELLIPLMRDDSIDIAAGFRLNRQEGFIRKMNAWAYGQFLVPLALGVRIKDLDCAFKLFHRRVIESIEIESTGALINAEIMAKAKKYGFRWKQVGVHHLPRQGGEPTGAKLSVILRMFRELFKLGGRIRKSSPKGEIKPRKPLPR